MKKMYFILFVFLLSGYFGFAQTTYYSKAAATDFNALATWGTATDGTGTTPSSISNVDNFIVSNASLLTLSANADVRALTLTSGKLTVASNTLTVAIAGQNNTELNAIAGTLEISGGTVIVNGAAYFANGSGLIQSGGLFSIDGNSGTATTSIGGASGTQAIFGIGYAAGSASSSISSTTNAAKFQLTGGTLRIVDPTISTSSSAYAFAFRSSTSSIHVNASSNHTLEYGDASSSNAGGNILGF